MPIDFRQQNDKAMAKRRARRQTRQAASFRGADQAITTKRKRVARSNRRRNELAAAKAAKANPGLGQPAPEWAARKPFNPKPTKAAKPKKRTTPKASGRAPRSTAGVPGGSATSVPRPVGSGTGGGAAPRAGGGNAPTGSGNVRKAASSGAGGAQGVDNTQPGMVGGFKPFDVRPFYQPALDALRQQRAASDSTRTANMEGLTKLNDWYANQMNTGQQALQQRLDASAAESRALTTDSQARMQEYAGNALSAVGNNADLAKQTGLTAATTAGEFGQQGANAGAIFNAAQGLTLSQRQDAERGIQSARVANLLQGLNANHLQRSMNLDTQESGLRGDLAKADLGERIRVQNMNEATRQANVQANIDAQLAEFTQQYQAGKLGVEQYKAQTGRIAATASARAAEYGLQLKAQGLSLQAGKLKLQQWVAKQNVTEKEKDRMLKVGIQRLKGQQAASGGTNNPSTQAAKEARTFVTGIETSANQPLSSIYKNDRHNYGQYANQLINHLASGWPTLSRVTVNRILRSHFAQDTVGDPRTQALIKQLFGK